MNIYGDDSCNDEPMSMIFPLRYRTDHFRFSHLSQQFFHQQRREKSSKMWDNKHASNIETGWHTGREKEILIHPAKRFLISNRKSFNTNIRQSIKRWKCLVSLGIRSLPRCSLQIKISESDTEFYSLFSTICTRCSWNEVVVCMYEMLGCIKTDSTFLSCPAVERKEETEGTFAFALE